MTPSIIGAYSAGGLYVARYLNGTADDVSWTALGAAAAIGAASAYAAPQISKSLVCPHSPGAPLVEAAASAAVSWAIVLSLTDMESANMFAPVQLGAHLVGTYAANYVRAWQVSGQSSSAAKASVSMDDYSGMDGLDM